MRTCKTTSTWDKYFNYKRCKLSLVWHSNTTTKYHMPQQMTTKKYYVVVHGRVPGIYTDWPTAHKNVDKFPGAVFKSFKSQAQAQEFLSASTHVKADTVEYRTMPLPDRSVIYTDGSYKDDSCGFGVIILTPGGERIHAHGRVPLKPTNNVAELYAIYVALSLVRNDVLLYSDSRYSITCLTTYVHSWMANGWGNAANRELIEKIYGLMQGRRIELQYVPGHSGVLLNEEVDRLADAGRVSTEQLIISRPGQLTISRTP